MMKKTALVVISALVLLSFAVGALAQDAAMVVDMKGEPAAYTSKDKAGQEVLLMDFLTKGEQINLPAESSIVLNYFVSGAREEIKGPGVVTVGMESSDISGDAQLQTAKVDYIPPPADANQTDQALHAGTVALRGMNREAPGLHPLKPTDTAVRDLPLHFAWRPVMAATGYQIIITDLAGKVVDKAKLECTEFTSQAEHYARGREYAWTVEALEGDEVMAEGGGKFFVLAENAKHEMMLTEQYIERTYPEESTERQIALAMLYKKYQLNDEAKEVLTGLSKKHPRNANIVRQLNELKTNYQPQS